MTPAASSTQAATQQKASPKADYFEQAIPQPYRILGLPLRPLSLGRYRLMKRFDVAFVADGEAKMEEYDLLMGLFICSMRCDEFIRIANEGRICAEVRKWSRRIMPHPWIGFIPWIAPRWRTKNDYNVLTAINLFKQYLAEAQVVPSYWDERPERGPSGSHWSQSMEVLLRSEVGWTTEEINEAPLSKAISDFFKLLESKGEIRIMTEDEINAKPLTEEQTGALSKMFESAERN